MIENAGSAGRIRSALLGSLAVATLASLGWQAGLADEVTAAEAKPVFMFVHTAESVVVDPTQSTLRLVKVNPQTLYFSDRPVRIAGHLTMADYLKEWTTGKDDFDEDPPNAALSVYEEGQEDNTLAVVELTNPVVDAADLVYTYKLIEGKLPSGGGPTALFIDRIGIGGGVGAGYHGVGVGRRGVGVR